ncbi:MAG: GAF domain-containing sensor histidine kinase [Drouetiella hepatica Uher 2000/2452]|uniref:histidine kinase n=1 Tax=Drouetiella hepatica Uher 2000/2452 TaxID=904376 RepID=A0A951QDT8_9CYAN|nr:GAF domain-containing sensor histidine kinase [Drouetiella hepatica Uher 2000/2452]
MPASSEFVALCQSQVALLTQGLKATLSIIYLTEELTEVAESKMVPVVAYPEAVAGWGEEQILSLLSRGNLSYDSRSYGAHSYDSYTGNAEVRSLQPHTSPQFALLPPYSGSDDRARDSHYDPLSSERPLEPTDRSFSRQQQVVLPIIHEEVVMGLLVTARADRAWTEAEQEQIEQIAKALALGCVLDQRSQWLLQDSRQQRLLREQRRDLFDNLLHQFRNPLTAMRTFGKLLTRRIRPEDANHTAAEGIVRESDRLQDLLKEFDAAIDLDETDLRRLLSATDSESPDATRPELTPRSMPLLSAALGDNLPDGGSSGSSSSGSASPNKPSSNHILLGTSIRLETCSIAQVLKPMLESVKAIAQDRQLELNADIPDLPPVQMDVRALREVLSNLLDNSLKYTPANGKIEVRVHRFSTALGHRQAIAIFDNGPGIPPQDLERLFERHYRGVQAATDIPGSGIGLAIARELVLQMQGEIEIFSPAATCALTQPSSLANDGDEPIAPQSLNQSPSQAPSQAPSQDSSQAPGTAVVVYLPEAPAVDF